MSLYQRILVSCDFSSPSLAALEHGACAAEVTGAELILLHVLPPVKKGDDQEGQRATAMHALEQALSADRVLRLNVKFLVREGAVAAREIVNAARELAVDLIIMGTRGRTGIAHLALGSVAESVLRAASCPVMTVRSANDETAVGAHVPALTPVEDELESSPAVDLLRRAVALRATDIHVDPISTAEFLVRLRIDGKLEEYCRLDHSVALRQFHQFKMLARVESSDPFHPREGRLRAISTLPDVEVRLTTSPVTGGEAIALRISARTQLSLPLDHLGLSLKDHQRVDEMLRRSEGLVLITGPTGSGKTTTVYAMLHRLASAQRNIVSIEDPVEYQVPYVRQLAVDERHNVTMTSGLKTLLRMDPDVIFVGEIRDAEAAGIAMQAASSGRQVLSTLHTRDVAATVTTLRDLHVEANSLAANISGVLNQRLVRRLCTACRTERDLSDSERATFVAAELEPPAKLTHTTGCDACRNRGFYGRVGIFEVARFSSRVAEAISQGAPEAVIRQLLRSDGIASLRSVALRKVAEGETSLAEIEEMPWA